MPGERTARRFDEISHLFLSSGERRGAPTRAPAEVTLWLAVNGNAYNRALVAAGAAEAFSRIGVRCTLVEIGRGLPNAGYYFALEPRDYLAPTLDESRVVAAQVDSRIRFVYAVDPACLEPFRPGKAVSDAPHVIVTAFRHPLGGRPPIPLPALAAVAGRFATLDGGGGERRPDGIVVFTDSCAGACTTEIDRSFRHPYPEAVLFLAERRPAEGTREDFAGTVVYPRELLRLWARRSPPAHPIFTDLATCYLQVLSHRRKRGVKRATS
jgi:hypothetical protein